MSQNEGHFAVNSVNSLTLVGKQLEFRLLSLRCMNIFLCSLQGVMLLLVLI